MDGKEQVTAFLDHSFDWLKQRPAMVETVMGVFRFLTLLLVIMPIHMVVVLVAEIVTPQIAKWSQNG